MQPKTWMAAAGLAALTGCAPMDEASGPTGEGSCGADGYGSLVGAQLAAVTMPADLNARIIGPDTMVTQDYQPGRLNIVVDEDGYITRVYCG
ncbi:I78 family peptidase inhibitor [Tranquillimonas alkanivorans]|uniref:Peptidase inhibitor I78 family protein n=1 Tax=Tranquillimonas alkanivorans TaxID=441119 RepID=A0A1I5L7M3_9RHOB|nr:I78 family peptidase inhibitor [Tranquillimonas alkanivorans]SFO93257.1 Peptidase inhibitor I78 family protein [Tranquillimonas alkanivorans]